MGGINVEDIDLDQFHNKTEKPWKWYLIRTTNTLP